MKSKLTKHLKTKEEKDKFSQYLLEHRDIFILLSGLIEDDLCKLHTESTSNTRYDEANWSYRQADYNGMTRAYGKIIDLLDIDQREDK